MSIYGPVTTDELFDGVPAPRLKAYFGTCVVCQKLYTTIDERDAQLCDRCADSPYECVRYIHNVLQSSQNRINSRLALSHSLTANDDVSDHIIVDENVLAAQKQHRRLVEWSIKAMAEVDKLEKVSQQ